MGEVAVGYASVGCTPGAEPRDAYVALREAVARECACPRDERPEIRQALRECAALAHRRAQPPEQYLVQIKACVREVAGVIDASLLEVLMTQVVTLSIREYYRDD